MLDPFGYRRGLVYNRRAYIEYLVTRGYISQNLGRSPAGPSAIAKTVPKPNGGCLARKLTCKDRAMWYAYGVARLLQGGTPLALGTNHAMSKIVPCQKSCHVKDHAKSRSVPSQEPCQVKNHATLVRVLVGTKINLARFLTGMLLAGQ